MATPGAAPTLTPEDVATLEQMRTTIAAHQEQITNLQQNVTQLTLQLVRQQQDGAALVQALQTRFEEQQAAFAAMQIADAALKEKVAALEARAGGGGGAPGSSGLVDTRILGRPKTSAGKASEWNNWSFVLYGFCGAVAGTTP